LMETGICIVLPELEGDRGTPYGRWFRFVDAKDFNDK
jgi:hypothetical protein